MFEDNSEECQLHEFKVVSWNGAGDSEPAVITETLPISSESAPLAVYVYNVMYIHIPYILPEDVICHLPYQLLRLQLVHYRS